MVTGVECAGLVLAVLPLFVEAGKAYSDGVETILNVSLRSRRDAELSDFYDEFYWAIGELSQYIKTISDSISDPTATTKPPSASQLGDWSKNAVVETKLRKYLRSETAFNKFTLTTKRIVQLLAQMLKEQGKYVSRTHQDELTMYKKLSAFALDRESKKTKSTFIERFQFFRKKADRDKCMERLNLWNDRLHGLIEIAKGAPATVTNAPQATDPQNLRKRSILLESMRGPSSPFYALVGNLYRTLSKSWSCACNSGHEAKFCLKIDTPPEKAASTSQVLDFDFLMSIADTQTGSCCWQEGTISVNVERYVLGPCQQSSSELTICSQHKYDEESKVVRMCETSLRCAREFQRVRLVMNDINGQQSLWRLDPKPKRIHFVETVSPATLEELLSGSTKLGAREKRELALTCAYSLLLLHDSPWLGGGWSKKQLFFFYKSDSEPDFHRPFLSTRFELPGKEVGQAGSGAFHPNSNILALGILLIEIFNEKPIESWRTAKERAVVTAKTSANTDLSVGCRVVKKMDDTPHRSAIEACLDIDWLPEGRKVVLEDADTRAGLFAKVIDPIEKEIEMLT